MTDIARIGFKADTNELDKAVLTLNKLNAASKGVATSTNQVARSVQGDSKAMAQAAADVARAVTLKGQANLKALQTSKSSTKAEIEQAQAALKSAKAEEANARSILATVKANESLKRATNAATQAQMKQMTLMERVNKVTGVSRGMPKSARDSAAVFGGIARDQMPNRFNTANIAAQFQDVGVTAAMGMNPLTIALQQGTQLSAILNTMESPLQGIAIAFRSIINPVSLMAIGFVGLVAALIQFVDWAKVGKSVLMGLADIIDATAPLVLSLVAVLTLLYAPAILGGIRSLAVTIATLGTTAVITGAKMAAAWLVAMGPVGWVAAGIATVLSLLFIFRDEIANLIGVDVIAMIGTGVNKIIGFFVGAFNAIKTTWSLLPAAMGSIMIETANKILGKLEEVIQGAVDRLNKLPGVDIQLTFDGEGNLANPYREQARAAGEIIAEEMGKAMNEDYLAIIGDGIDNVSNKIRSFAGRIDTSGGGKDKKGGKTSAEQYEEIIGAAKRRVATLRAEQAAIGLTEEAAAKLKYEQELINQAMQKNIKLSPEQRKELGELAGTMSRIEEETRRVKEAMDFAKSGTEGFFKDLRSGLEKGEGLMKSFANAAINALNKVLDKMMEIATENLFRSSSSSGGGILGSILGGLGGLFGGGTSGAVAQASARGAANPALYGPGFAKGGVFTNSVVSNPTMFKFANGGKFGVMGEAGPEAVMPLHRGSDGSLGVKMNGGGLSGDNITYNIDARGAAPGVEEDIKRALYEVDKLRKDTPKIAIESIKDANNRNLGLLR